MSQRITLWHLDVIQQGTLTVLNRQTSFGTFGGGDAIISIPLVNICGTSGGNTTPGGNDGSGSPPGSTTAPGGNTAPGGGGKSVAWSTRRADPDATVVSPVPGGAAAKSASIAMAGAPAKVTCVTRRR